MKIEVYFEPVFHIIIKNIFLDKENKEILKEAIKNKKKFIKSSTTGKTHHLFRTNTTAFYDQIYLNKRDDSVLLREIAKVFKTNNLIDMLVSSPYPLSLFRNTNYHVTQVSRYGSKSQKYNWHVDGMVGNLRIISFVYYFNIQPKKYSGGEFQLTNSPIVSGKTVIKKADIKTIIPENNMCIIFGSQIPHRVLPTKSSDIFKNGRFSVNCWIGMKQ